MNVEIGTEAAQFPEKEYVDGIFFAVRSTLLRRTLRLVSCRKRKIGEEERYIL
jgi:hypothetical protein